MASAAEVDSRAAATIIWGLVPDRIADKPTSRQAPVTSARHWGCYGADLLFVLTPKALRCDIEPAPGTFGRGKRLREGASQVVRWCLICPLKTSAHRPLPIDLCP